MCRFPPTSLLLQWRSAWSGVARSWRYSSAALAPPTGIETRRRLLISGLSPLKGLSFLLLQRLSFLFLVISIATKLLLPNSR